jgi:5-hydroxyisourate hydrolase-like protein (transthyretin family)
LGCGKEVRLPGGFKFKVVHVRSTKPCYYCRKAIYPPSVAIVEERFRIDRKYYHVNCFLAQYGYRLKTRVGPGGLEICLG